MFDFEQMSPRKFNLFCLITFFLFQALMEVVFRTSTEKGDRASLIVLIVAFAFSIFLGWYGFKVSRLKQAYLGLFFGFFCWSVEESLEKITLFAQDPLFCTETSKHPMFWVRFEDLPFAIIILFLYFIILDLKFQVSDKIPLHVQVAFPFVMTGWILTDLARANRVIFEYKGFGAYLIVSICASILFISTYQLFRVRKEAGPVLVSLITGSLISTIAGLVYLIKNL